MKRNVLFLFALLLLLPLTFSCDLISDLDNNAPEIEMIEVSAAILNPNETVWVTCYAVDEDGDELDYYWTAESGMINSDETASVIQWTAPEFDGNYRIDVEVSDREATAYGSVNILVYGGVAASDTLILLIPSNGAAGMQTTLHFIWSFDEPENEEVTYSFYLGTTDEPYLYQGGIEEQRYEVNDLAYNTTYYWRVVAYGGGVELFASDTFTFKTASSSIAAYQSIFPLEVGNVRVSEGMEISGYYDWSREVVVRDTSYIVDSTRVVESAMGLAPEEGVLAYRLLGSEIDAWFAFLSYGIYCRNSYGEWFEWDAFIDYPQPSGTVLEEEGDEETWTSRLWVQNADSTVTVNGVTFANCYVVNKYEYPYYGTSYRLRERIYAPGVGMISRVITIADKVDGEFGDFYQEIMVLDRVYNIYD